MIATGLALRSLISMAKINLLPLAGRVSPGEEKRIHHPNIWLLPTGRVVFYVDY